MFSNQLPSNSIQSMEVISGAPPAEYGGKTSLVIVVTTRSGEGVKKPTGNITASYGTFGSVSGGLDLGYGGENWGNFFELDGLNTGRFLDPPEFTVFHDKGNEQNVFDRIDYKFTAKDSVRLNLNYSRSWFQTPNAYDNLNISNVIAGGTTANPVFGNVGNTDQHSKIETFDISPTFTHLIGANAVLNFGAYVRKDAYNYYPSENALADLGPPNLQNQTVGQSRITHERRGARDILLCEGNPDHQGWSGVRADFPQGARQSRGGCVSLQCALRGCQRKSAERVFRPIAMRGGRSTSRIPTTLLSWRRMTLPAADGHYNYFGHTDVKEMAMYIEDQIKARNWLFNLGIRGDLYNGLAVARQAEPRVGISYNIQKTNTVLRVSYARTLETPFNENLVLSSQGCSNDVLNPLLACTPGVREPWSPVSATSFTPDSSRLLEGTWCSAGTTSGSTHTMPSISACWAILRLRSQSIGITPRSRAMRCGWTCRIITT